MTKFGLVDNSIRRKAWKVFLQTEQMSPFESKEAKEHSLTMDTSYNDWSESMLANNQSD